MENAPAFFQLVFQTLDSLAVFFFFLNVRVGFYIYLTAISFSPTTSALKVCREKVCFDGFVLFCFCWLFGKESCKCVPSVATTTTVRHLATIMILEDKRLSSSFDGSVVPNGDDDAHDRLKYDVRVATNSHFS